jgi:predicted acetyltransferase
LAGDDLSVSDFSVRVLEGVELRAASDLFRATVHYEPVTDEQWEYFGRLNEPGRTLGAFADGKLIGTTLAFTSSLTVPGGAALPMAAVTGVGVRSDHTRRGVLTELMRVQLTDMAKSGYLVAGLHASEGGIYGRFGYGIATTSRSVRVDRRRAEFRPSVPRGGDVRLLDPDEVLETLPTLYDRMLGTRPGMISRPASWWAMAYERRLRSTDHFLVAVHTGPDGPDGFVGYLPVRDNPQTMVGEVTIRATDLVGTPAAINDIWRYLLSIDLASNVFAWSRPLDEPVEAMLRNQHAVTSELDDDLWVRIIDVPRTLASRTYQAAEPIVIEVTDSLLPNNSDRYLIGPDGATRTPRAASLAMDVDVLAMLYLGTTRASTLASVGRIEAYDPAVLPHADRLFATDLNAWSGTMF